jgi:hypothetical protein
MILNLKKIKLINNNIIRLYASHVIVKTGAGPDKLLLRLRQPHASLAGETTPEATRTSIPHLDDPDLITKLQQFQDKYGYTLDEAKIKE